MGDLFADPDPRDIFQFTFHQSTNNNNNNNNSETTGEKNDLTSSSIHVKLSGYKMENGQILRSTGLTLWTASPRLCEYLVTTTTNNNQQHHQATTPIEFIRNRRVLELGAGLGLCGIVAHKLGAKQVVLTDGDTDTLKEMKQNVEANCRSAISASGGIVAETITCHQLRWGHRLDEFRERHGTFDTILAADVVYLEEMLHPLFDTVVKLLDRDRGRFLLSYTRRNVNIDLVLNSARERNFVWMHPEGIEDVYIMQNKTAMI
uniref:Calmodulin-lysine N-methyltransferase n=1 Tax=Grammatophora oceanica TaxID=210454 RepID=A0A7S1Y3T4_9STRA